MNSVYTSFKAMVKFWHHNNEQRNAALFSWKETYSSLAFTKSTESPEF